MATVSVRKNKRKSQEPRKLSAHSSPSSLAGNPQRLDDSLHHNQSTRLDNDGGPNNITDRSFRPAVSQTLKNEVTWDVNRNAVAAPQPTVKCDLTPNDAELVVGEDGENSYMGNEAPVPSEQKRLRLTSSGSEEERSPTSTEYATSNSRSPSPTEAASRPVDDKSTLPSGTNNEVATIRSPSQNGTPPSRPVPKTRVKLDCAADKQSSQSLLSPEGNQLSKGDHGLGYKNLHGLNPELSSLPFLLPALMGISRCPVPGLDNVQAVNPDLVATGLHINAFNPLLTAAKMATSNGLKHVQPPEQEEPLALVVKNNSRQKEMSSDIVSKTESTADEACAAKAGPPTGHKTIRAKVASSHSRHSSVANQAELAVSDISFGSKQRNYKNLTRERRVEANARERQRVHTITAAFDTLQAALPTEEENPKMSKLSVIKIATAYIMALSRMAGYDYTEDQSAPSVQEVIRHCQEVIHMETKTKKRGALSSQM